MKRMLLVVIAALLATNLANAKEKEGEAADQAELAEVNYTKAIEARTADILKVLALTDTNKIAHVHDAVIGQYRALRAWHDENDGELKTAKSDTNLVAKIRATMKPVHEAFLSKLAEDLTPEQVEQVKDKMTYGKVQFTFKGYLVAYPNLAEEHKQKIMELLKQAREEAMDGGSSDEKTAVFQRYKGKINNYLSKQGIHPEKTKPISSPPTNAPV